MSYFFRGVFQILLLSTLIKSPDELHAISFFPDKCPASILDSDENFRMDESHLQFLGSPKFALLVKERTTDLISVSGSDQ